MTNRVVIGKKGSDLGLWCSKPGVDVLTTGVDGFMLDMTYHSDQIVQQGLVGVGGVVGMGLAFPPVVMLYTVNNYQGTTGMVRPFPNVGGGACAYAVVSAGSFFVGFETPNPSGLTPNQYYFVMRRRLS